MLTLYRILFNNIGAEGFLFGVFGISVESIDDVIVISPESGLVILSVLAILWALASYFIGSLNFAIIISRLKYRDDVRKHGSANAGTTNMQRTYGNVPAVLTLAGDIAKTLIAVLGARIMFGLNAAFISALLCIVGHCFPVYYKFKGGKGVACSFAALAVLEPILFIVLILLYVIIVFGTKYVSLGSVTVSLLFPVFLDRFYGLLAAIGAGVPSHPTLTMAVCSIIMTVIIVVRHWGNIRKLLRGEENKLVLGKKRKEKEAKIRKEKEEQMKNQKYFSLHNIDDDDEDDKED